MTSTSQVFNTTIGFIEQSQDRLFEVQRQISSGLKHDGYEDLAGTVSRLKSLEDAVARTDSYIDTITRVMPRLQSVDTAISQLIDIAGELRDNLSVRQTPGGSGLDLGDIATGNLENIRELLNTQVDSQYIFGGGETNGQPIRSNVNIVANYTSSSADPFTTNANYYTGDTRELSARVSDGREVTYGITADAAAIQDLISAAHLAIEYNTTEDSDIYALASTQINDAIDNLLSLRLQNGNDLAVFEDARDSHQLAKLKLNEQVADITNTDIVEASIDAALNETILQATFQTFGRISNLSLVDFLR